MKNALFSSFRLCFVAVALLASGLTARAQDTVLYTTLHQFNGSDGTAVGTLVKGDDGNFYGTTSFGGFGYDARYGSTGNGTVFRITPAGVVTTIYAFAGAADGAHPYGLSKGLDGNFYGLTVGTDTGATVFRITPAGTLTTIYSTDYAVANGPLVQDDSGNFYGVSYSGGSDYGSIFRLTPAGVYTTLHLFTGDGSDGAAGSTLTRGSDGNFYGAGNLGPQYSGTIYQITPAGAFKALYTFTGGTDGFLPDGVTLGPDGNLYGTTLGGGANGNGLVYRVTNAGQYTVIYNFTDGSDSGAPIRNLVLGADGNFYGVAAGDTLPEATTSRQPAQPMAIAYPPFPPVIHVIQHPSTVFRITPAGVLTSLYASETTIGAFVLGGDGTFYGAVDNAIDNESSLFKLTVVSHPAFFAGQAPLVNGLDYLAFPNGNYFGYYSFLSDPKYLYHFDLGYEYLIDANDRQGGLYLYDFASSDFFYTSRTLPFPYLYDFGLGSVLYYFPDPQNPGHYYSGGTRYFYDFGTGKVITK